MNTLKKLPIILVLLAAFASTKIYGQLSESYELTIYRPAQSMMSGGMGMEIKVFINEQEVGTLPNGTMLNYSVFSQGELKVKFVSVGLGTVVGSPAVINLEAKHGESTSIEVSYRHSKGAEAKIPKEKELIKLKKRKWSDTMKGQEDTEKPLIL